MKLYFAPGACSRVTMIALEKTKAAFETELLVFKRGDHRSASYLGQNPSGKVPLLLVGDQALSQNPVILTFLNKQYPDAGILPKPTSAMEEYQILSRLFRFSADIHPLVTRIRIPQFFCDVEGSAKRVKEIGMEAIAFHLQSFENDLEDKLWLGGSDWCVLDAYLHWVWFRIVGAGFDGSKYPRLTNHYARTLELPEVEATLAREAEAEAWLEANDFAIKFEDL